MTKALKASLLSALILPGVGHLYLKKHIRGYLIIFASLTSLYFFIASFFRVASMLFEKILQGKINNPNIEQILKLLENEESKSHIGMISIATWFMFFLWAFATIDSYRIGRIQKTTTENLEISQSHPSETSKSSKIV